VDRMNTIVTCTTRQSMLPRVADSLRNTATVAGPREG
jgi:hypothetical protein